MNTFWVSDSFFHVTEIFLFLLFVSLLKKHVAFYNIRSVFWCSTCLCSIELYCQLLSLFNFGSQLLKSIYMDTNFWSNRSFFKTLIKGQTTSCCAKNPLYCPLGFVFLTLKLWIAAKKLLPCQLFLDITGRLFFLLLLTLNLMTRNPKISLSLLFSLR